MKKIILILLGIVVLWLGWKVLSPKDKNAAEKTNTSASPASVSVMVIQSKPFAWKLEAVGTVIPNEQVTLQAESTGKIVSLNFTEGVTVSKGQVLVRLNDAEEQAQLKKITVSEAFLENDLSRKKSLLSVGGLSQEEVDRTQIELDNLRADKQLLLAQINKKQIVAPFSGTIGLRYVSEGEYVTQTTNIATLLQSHPVKIEFSIPEKYSGEVKQGKFFTVELIEIDSTFSSTIYAVEPAVNKNTRDIKARGVLDNKKGEITPGSFAKVSLTLREYTDAILVPSHTLASEMSGLFAWVVKNGKAEKIKLKTGARTATEILVLEGLYPGDTLITTGLLMVRPGMLVNPIIQEKK